MAIVCLGFATKALSQANDSKGTDFWLMFNGNLGTPVLTIFITSDVNTSGTLSIPGLAFSTPFTVTANTVTPVVLPTAASVHTNGVVDSKGIHITSLQEVTVYGLNYIFQTADAYLGLPTDVLGTDYMILTYRNSNIINAVEFGIVGTVNGTVVTIIPSVVTAGHPAGVPFNITLNQGQTYELVNTNVSPADLTGTIITSTQPIGVMGASQCSNIPGGATFCDHIVEMLPPTTTWGKKFGTVPLKSRINGDTWRFMASQDGTTVSINGVAQTPVLNRGQYLEKILTAQSVIESDKPILVAQYANGSSFSGNPGDPFMMLIPPLEQFLAKYTVTNVAGYVANFINVIAPSSIAGSLIVDGAPVPAASFTPIGSTGFSGAQISVAVGTHNLSGSLPFGVFVYGFNTDDAYGYPGGQSFSAIASVTSVALTPANGTAPVGTETCFDALVKDQFNNPLAGIRVDFTITGVNPGSSGFAFTNTSGIAHFCYTGVNVGTDNIVASVGTVRGGPSTFVWMAAPSNVYYSKSTGDLHNVLTWGKNMDGSGANPPDFGAGKTFMLANRAVNYTMTADWTVGGILNIPGGSQLQIGGYTLSIADINGTGQFNATVASNLIVTQPSSSGTSLNFINTANNLNNLTISSGATTTLASALNIYGVLTEQAGTFNTANSLTLKSTATNTARVAPVTGSISGTVTVERYIPARRAWRIMSAPVGGSQTINQAWQEGATTSSVNPNPVPGYGTHITEGSPTDGFDHNPLIAMTSIKKYVSATDTWNPLSNTNATPVNSDAYLLFVRGDRGIPLGLNTVPPTTTTLRATGPLKVGDQTFPVSASGFTAIPNPFASPINFATLTKTNVQNNFYLWDPKMGGTDGVGGYVLLSFNGTSYDITPAAVSPESQYIQSGQGFLVHSTGTAGSLVIKESDKSATPAMDVFRVASTGASGNANPFNVNVSTKSAGLRINLQSVNADNTTSLLDEVFSSYGTNFSDKVDELDAQKLANVEENLAIARGNHNLMIDRSAALDETDTIQLKLWNTVAGKRYAVEFNPVNLSTTVSTAYLLDNYLKTSTPVSLNKIFRFYFNVTPDAASTSSNRFTVVFKAASDQGMANNKNGIITYPNPVTGKTIQLMFNDQPQGTYKVELVNGLGQTIYTNQINHGGGSAIQKLELVSKPVTGIYLLNITNSNRRNAVKVVIK